MITSWDGIKLISKFEGFSATTYKDVGGKPTIGYGHLIKEGEDIQSPIDNVTALSLLQNDVKEAEGFVNEYVTVPLQQYEFDALVSFTYNLGGHNLLESTLLEKLNHRDYQGAANEFPKWDRVNGQVVDGIENRRNKEKDLFLTGDYRYG